MKKDNRGALFVNDRKEKETHPDFKGSAIIGGSEYWISGWRDESSKGVKYHALSFEPKNSPAKDAGYKKAKQSVQSEPENFDDEIPF